jgi:hypothetical protein
MDLIDKEDNFILYLRCFIDYLFETSLELATILRPSHHHRKIERYDTFISHREWHFAEGDFSSKTFDNCCFSYSWITDKTRVIFGLAVQDTHKSIYLRIATDHWIYLSSTSFRSEILSEKIQCWGF